MAIKKKIILLLISALFFSVFSGGYHHLCNYHSQTRLTVHSADTQSVLFPVQTAASDFIPPFPGVSTFLFPQEFVPDHILMHQPRKGRAPPLGS